MNSLLRIVFGTFVIIGFTQLSWDAEISGVEIPITGQTFAVLLIGYLFSIKEGLLSVVLYILMGALGLAVFADNGAGMEVILGNSGGFIIGFIFGVLMVGVWSRFYSNTWGNALLAMIFGTLIIILFGVLRLSLNIGFSQALEYGLYPFWIGAIIKIVLGAIVAKLLKERMPIFN